MNIIKKPTPNFTVGRGNYHPEVIVIHVSAGSIGSCDSWFANPVSQVSSHYIVGLKGEVHQYVDDMNTAYTQGRVDRPTAKIVISRPGVNPNKYCIGIENEGTDLAKGTPIQLATLAELVRNLANKYGITLDRTHIIGHKEIFSAKPNCPSPDITIIDKIIALAKGSMPVVDEMVVISVPKRHVDKLLAYLKTL